MTSRMTDELTVKALDALTGADPETDHQLADEALLALVSPNVRAAYRRLVKRCGWWATA